MNLTEQNLKFPKAFLFTFLFIIFTLLPALIALIPGVFDNTNFLKIANFYLSLPFIPVIIWFIYLLKRNEINLPEKTNQKWYLIAIILGIIFPLFQKFVLTDFYNFLFKTEYKIEYNFNYLKKFNLDLFFKSIPVILIFPILEELFFREIIQKRLKKTYTFLQRIIITTFLFSLIHFPFVEIALGDQGIYYKSFFTSIFGGFLLAYLFEKSKSIGPTLLMHIIWNLFVTVS